MNSDCYGNCQKYLNIEYWYYNGTTNWNRRTECSGGIAPSKLASKIVLARLLLQNQTIASRAFGAISIQELGSQDTWLAAVSKFIRSPFSPGNARCETKKGRSVFNRDSIWYMFIKSLHLFLQPSFSSQTTLDYAAWFYGELYCPKCHCPILFSLFFSFHPCPAWPQQVLMSTSSLPCISLQELSPSFGWATPGQWIIRKASVQHLALPWYICKLKSVWQAVMTARNIKRRSQYE